MNRQNLRRLLTAVLAVATLTTVPMHAGKRRAVQHPSAPRTQVTGTVVDAGTGAPVIGARVETGETRDTTDSSGKFSLRLGEGASADLTVSRSGYVTQTVRASAGQTITVRLVSTPTVTVKKTDGTTLQVDYESLEFGYLPTPFAGYRSSESEDFCTAGGSAVSVNKSEIRKITGPGVLATSTCCTTNRLLRVNVELKNGTKGDMFFTDLCEGAPTVDLIARNHVTGKFVYISFKDIAELTFP